MQKIQAKTTNNNTLAIVEKGLVDNSSSLIPT